MFRFLDTNYKFKSLTPDNYLKIFEANETENSKEVSEDFEKKYIQAVRGLFKKSYVVALDKGKRESIQKIEALIQMQDVKYSACKDLLMVIKELDAIPPRFLKQIRTINRKNLKRFRKLIIDIPPDYLNKIISKAKAIDKEVEKLIISEEIVPYDFSKNMKENFDKFLVDFLPEDIVFINKDLKLNESYKFLKNVN